MSEQNFEQNKPLYEQNLSKPNSNTVLSLKAAKCERFERCLSRTTINQKCLANVIFKNVSRLLWFLITLLIVYSWDRKNDAINAIKATSGLEPRFHTMGNGDLTAH